VSAPLAPGSGIARDAYVGAEDVGAADADGSGSTGAELALAIAVDVGASAGAGGGGGSGATFPHPINARTHRHEAVRMAILGITPLALRPASPRLVLRRASR
jgi:hypothetical protein